MFTYVQNNPVNYLDFSGMFIIPQGGPDNGNVWPGPRRQDGVCSLPSILGAEANSNNCILNCCREHDKCYARYKCNWSSWINTFSGFWGLGGGKCGKCNSDVLACIAKASVNPDCWCP